MSVRPRWDPHTNLFYYYRADGTERERKRGRERQLENNTTKAFIHTLKRCPEAAASLLEQLGMEIGSQRIHYALQRTPINAGGLKRLRNRYVLGVSPSGEIGSDVGSTERTIPDAWIWTRDTVIAFENKTTGSLDHGQLVGHAQRVRAPRQNIIATSWVEIHDLLKRIPGRNTQVFVNEFTDYLELLGLSRFVGFHKEDFEIFLHRDSAQEEKARVRDQLRNLLEAVHEELPDEFSDQLDFYAGIVERNAKSIWGTMHPKGKKPVNVAHYQWVMNYWRLRVAAWLEGAVVQRRLRKLAKTRRDDLVGTTSGLKDCSLVLYARHEVRPRKWSEEEVLRISMDWATRPDYDHFFNRLDRMKYFSFQVAKDYDPEEVCSDYQSLVERMVKDVVAFTPIVRLINQG